MPIKTIPLSNPEANLRTTLNECAESGDTIVVELPDQRFVAFQSLEPSSDDNLIDELIVNNSGFRDMILRSNSGPRNPFVRVGEDSA